MATININGNEIHYEFDGDGPPLVLVHGSWTDSDSWAQALVPLLAERYRVIRYDRRGHSRSERPIGAWTRRDNEDDLAGLIEALELGPVGVVGNSYGSLISLGLAARRPELFSAIAVHEPAAFDYADAASQPSIQATMDLVMAEIEAGEHEVATRRFIEEIALGPGGWELLPPPMRGVLVSNAPEFAIEFADSGFGAVAVEKLEGLSCPILLTRGDSSPAWLMQVADTLADRMPNVEAETIAGAGHAPHLTHPDDYATLIDRVAGGVLQVSI
jgi:pimeloyl-ACP methyl ester carboxylesterase